MFAFEEILLFSLTVWCSLSGSSALLLSDRQPGPYAKDFAFRSSMDGKRETNSRDYGLQLAPDGNLKELCSDSTGQYLYAAEWPGYIYKSQDSGRSWNVTESENAQWSGIISDSTGQFLAATAHSGGVYLSKDFGQSWNISSAPAYVPWSGIASDSSGRNLVACWSIGNITISNDGGESWTNSGAPIDSWMEVASDGSGKKLYASTFGGFVYYSYDQGMTWVSVPVLTTFSASSMLTTNQDGSVVAVVFYSGPIFVSVDYGVSYAQLSSNDFWTSVALNSIGNQIVVANSLGTISLSTSYGQNWTTLNAPDYPWQAVTSSADGQYLAAAFEGYDSIFMSPDFGETWTQYEQDSTEFNWFAVASDTSGERLTAVVYGGFIYSSVNYGKNWTRTSAPYGFWYDLACDQNATKIAAVQNYGGVFLSVDSGLFWHQIEHLPQAAWSGIAMTGNGNNLAATILGGGIWISGDGGDTWTLSRAPTFAWTAISASATSSYFVAVQGGGYLAYNNYSYVYISSDFGENWVRTNEFSSGWVAVSADSTGKDVLAATSGGLLYYSNTFGENWNELQPPYFYTWESVALNASGEFILAGSSDGGVWISFNSGVLWNLTTLSANLLWQGVATDVTGHKIAAIASGNAGAGGIYISSSYGVRWQTATVTEGPISCPAGYILAGVICVPCPAGTTSPAGTSTSCTPCPTGSYSSIAGAAYCLSCPLNYYQANEGATQCSSCPGGFITNDVGATKEEECLNSGGAIVLGLVCLVISILLVNVYLCYGRLNRISLYRKRHLTQPSLQRAHLAQKAADLLMTADAFVNKSLQYVSSQTNVVGKWIFFLLGVVLIMFATILAALFYGLMHILFTSLILYRGYMTYEPMPRNYREVIRRLFDAFGVSGVAPPFETIGGALAESNMDLTAVEAACTGGISAQYLLIYLILAGLVLIMIRSELQVYWKMGLEPYLTRMFSYVLSVFKRQDAYRTQVRTTDWLQLMIASFIGFLFYILPSPRKVIQFLIGYIYIFRFFDHDGRHESNDNCSGMDTAMSVATSAYVYLIALPVLVLLVSFIAPGFGRQPDPSVDNENVTTRPSDRSDSMVSSRSDANGHANNKSTEVADKAKHVYVSHHSSNHSKHLSHIVDASANVISGDFNTDYVKFADDSSTGGHSYQSQVKNGDKGGSNNNALALLNTLLAPVFSTFSVIGGIDWIVTKISCVFLHHIFREEMVSLSSLFTSTTSSLSSTSLAANIASFGSKPAKFIQYVKDQTSSNAASTTFGLVPTVTWLGMLSPYEKPYSAMTPHELHYAQRFTWAKANPSSAGLSFVSMVGQVQQLLCTYWHTTPASFMEMIVIKPLSYVIVTQLCTQVGRVFWWHVLRSYLLFVGVSLGIWTEASVDEYDLLHDYLRFQRMFYFTSHPSPSSLSTATGEPSRFTDDIATVYSYDSVQSTSQVAASAVSSSANVQDTDLTSLILAEHQRYRQMHHSKGDALLRAVYDDPARAFQQYLFALLSVRLSLLQLIPVFTLWSIFAVEISSRVPLFVFANSMRVLLPAWWEAHAWQLARQLLEDEELFWQQQQQTSAQDIIQSNAGEEPEQPSEAMYFPPTSSITTTPSMFMSPPLTSFGMASSSPFSETTPSSAEDTKTSRVPEVNQLKANSVKEWEVWLLGTYIWSRRSRIVEFFLLLCLTAAGCVLVFSPAGDTGDDTVGDTDDTGNGSNDGVTGMLGFCIFLLVVTGVCQSMVYVLRLHRWLFPRHRRVVSLTPAEDTINNPMLLAKDVYSSYAASNQNRSNEQVGEYVPPVSSV